MCFIRLFAVIALATTLVHPAHADDAAKHPRKLAKMLPKLKITLADAIAKAEAKASGTAFAADLAFEKEDAVYEIKVMTRGDKTAIVEVRVDAMSGELLAAPVDAEAGAGSGAAKSEGDKAEAKKSDDKKDDDKPEAKKGDAGKKADAKKGEDKKGDEKSDK